MVPSENCDLLTAPNYPSLWECDRQLTRETAERKNRIDRSSFGTVSSLCAKISTSTRRAETSVTLFANRKSAGRRDLGTMRLL